jgi:hypothetical protein
MSLPTTTFSKAVTAQDGEVYLASLSGIIVGTLLAAGVEIMSVYGFGAGTIAKVLRGREGTATVAHASGDTVSIGTGVDFSIAPLSALIQGTTPDRTTSVITQDSTPTASTTSTPIATVTS